MPEHSEIKRMAVELTEVIKGLICVKITINEKSRYMNGNLFHSDYEFDEEKNGKRIFEMRSVCKGVKSLGKKLIFGFKKVRFISSCLLHGHWTFKEPPNASRCIKFVDKDDNVTNIFYEDSINNGLFSIVNNDSPNQDYILKDVGPDYMSDEVDLIAFANKVTRPGISKRHIQDHLMNQAEFSGVGNYLKAEILYVSRIHPQRECGDLTKNEIKRLFKNIKSIINETYECGGLTISTYLSPKGIKGTYSPKVYKRTVDSEGNKVKTLLDKNNRKTYYVEELQI